MFYGFQTSREDAAIGALLVYGIYRSRDQKRFKVTPDMWTTIESAVKSSAKRAADLTDFVEKLKPKLRCGTVQPRHMRTDMDTLTMQRLPGGELLHVEDQGRRQFWTELLESADDQAVLETLYAKTSLVIALVRDRLEREKPYEANILKEEDVDNGGDDENLAV